MLYLVALITSSIIAGFLRGFLRGCAGYIVLAVALAAIALNDPLLWRKLSEIAIHAWGVARDFILNIQY
jgi:hypothetical protein